MTKKGPVIVLGIGILVALLVSIVSYNFLKGKAQKQIQTQETVDIAVAAVDMAWGTVLNSQMMKTAPYLRKSLPSGSPRDCKVPRRQGPYLSSEGE